ncbi:hypothetical protein [Paractinoplanes lichenicola]|uniref:Penicillin-binding protein n=1 Tax=Paractinoplanes lichenicola TaxID=2802976 RepID=A0ABS1W3R7_9ACTN|nr:hypothetical protein [Actinoplanes lichenicola]MBL7261381.1 hypothetical protein [Actinoplanes lichenicola]
MPVIDLDSRPPADRPRRTRRGPHLLIIAAAAALLLGVPGEAAHLPSVFDDLCGYLAATGQPGAGVTVIDADSGEIVQTTTISGDC